MAEELRPELPPKVNCSTCGKEVPRAEAKSAEAQDYMMYFCGMDCFRHWQKESGSNAQSDS